MPFIFIERNSRMKTILGVARNKRSKVAFLHGPKGKCTWLIVVIGLGYKSAEDPNSAARFAWSQTMSDKKRPVLCAL